MSTPIRSSSPGSSTGKVHLPVVSSLRHDGSRDYPYPADVGGRFTWARRVTFAVLIAIWAALPWVHVNGRPAMFLDVAARRFFLFGASFNAQDFWLVFFVTTALLFALVVVTTVLGRAWCGWTCPQTVFLEALYRPIERWIEGPRNERMKRDRGPWVFDKVWRKGLKHFLYVFVSLFVAHVFLAYFVSIPSLFEMITRSPAEHPEAFGWMIATSAIFWLDFGWFREQLCLVICPYGRLQSAMVDDDSLVVGYDVGRGEPRGKGKRKESDSRGDCVDCNRCVVVCPTGIDIRNGLQVDCIACTQCIDACDDVMDKIGKPRGLIRYDSLRGLRGEPRKLWRPRLAFYGVLGVLGIVAASLALRAHAPFEANLVRMQGAPYVVERAADAADDVIRNQFQIHLVNKQDEPRTFRIDVIDDSGAEVVLALSEVTIEALGDRRISLIARERRADFAAGERMRVRVSMEGEPEPRDIEAPLLGPIR
ncbi:Cytochrome c oxidase accessory protein CcoG [Sandaracinus amylolyticus]|nr:Cytochrome c oxidase accessory protein CcoG [Sandaracinus amylolyticus]